MVLASLVNFEGAWEIETSQGEIWKLQHPGGLLGRLAGVGFPSAIYASQKAPGQHGDSHLGYVLDVRTIQAGFTINGQGGYEDCLVDVRLDNPYHHLSYLSNPLIVRRQTDLNVRELHDVWYAGGMERDSDNVSLGADAESLAMQLVARDPIWFDPTLKSYTATILTGATGDELVFDTPGGVVGPTAIFSTVDYLTFGSSSINLLLNGGQITTLGDWYTFPTITIVGPGSYPEIENLTSGQIITLDYDIPAGRTVTFDLRYGYKTVTDDLGTNLVGYIPITDDLADFCLWPAPLVAGGANVIHLFLAGATGATRFTLGWYDRYLGV